MLILPTTLTTLVQQTQIQRKEYLLIQMHQVCPPTILAYTTGGGLRCITIHTSHWLHRRAGTASPPLQIFIILLVLMLLPPKLLPIRCLIKGLVADFTRAVQMCPA